jgi:hypothetical protein
MKPFRRFLMLERYGEPAAVQRRWTAMPALFRMGRAKTCRCEAVWSEGQAAAS